MDELKRTMTREELHELVWSTPMQKLAELYGLSDRGLAKTCERHLVPVPPRGYWAKIEAGQTPKRTRLRAVENTALHTVHIGFKPANPQSEYLAHVLAAARSELEREDETLVATAPVIEAPKGAAPFPKQTPVTLEGNVKRFIADLRKCKSDRDGYISLKWIKITPSDVDRVGALIGSVQNELEPFGFSFDCLNSRVGFTKNGTRVDFGITAPRKKVVTISKSGWKDIKLEHVGRLNFQIWGQAEGIAKNWADTDHRTIEESVSKVVESFRINHVANREHNENRRLEEERRAHLRHRRELVELRKKREEDRLTFLRWIADARREADDLRKTIAAVPQSGELPPDYGRMIDWARNRLAELENQTEIKRLQATLVERQLYTDPDSLFDPEGDLPPKKNYWDD